MEKHIIEVPAGITYLSDWAKMKNGYGLEKYQFPHIVNKQITGCGFTSYCLTCPDLNVILCSPRRILLENKEEQLQGQVFYYRGSLHSKKTETDFDKDIKKKSKIKEQEEIQEEDLKEIQRDLIAMNDSLNNYYVNCVTSGKACKIIVTYDSFRHVVEMLGASFKDFYVVVDEFQSIFTDSRFKSDTEMEFLNQLKGIQRLCYVSATPMLDTYLDMMDDFKDLPYYEFDWAAKDPCRVAEPNIDPHPTSSVMSEAISVIKSYKAGEFEKYPYRDETGKVVEIESREAVLFFNSVSNICDLIRKCELTQEECNVLCSKDDANKEKVRLAFGVSKKDFKGLGTVPKKGEQHKMFTFCTRTVYLGADFYSTNARSFVFADSNIDCLSVDISLDLPQIVGRQRLVENPWRNSAVIYFKPTDLKNYKTAEEFKEYLNNKKKISEGLLESYKSSPTHESKQSLVNMYEKFSKYDNYKDNYVAVNHHAGSEPIPVFNSLVMISEMRAFEIQQVDYKDRFTVLSAMCSNGPEEVSLKRVKDTCREFDKIPTFSDKMRFACECSLTGLEKRLFINNLPPLYNNYYRILGPERITALSFRRCDLAAEYKKILNNQEIDVGQIIISNIFVGEKYTKPKIKEILTNAYRDAGYNSTAKATDIIPYFNLKECDMTDKDTGKRLHGYYIISLKPPVK